MSELRSQALADAAADQWKILPSGLTVLVRPMPGYSGTHLFNNSRRLLAPRVIRSQYHLIAQPASNLSHFRPFGAIPVSPCPDNGNNLIILPLQILYR